MVAPSRHPLHTKLTRVTSPRLRVVPRRRLADLAGQHAIEAAPVVAIAARSVRGKSGNRRCRPSGREASLRACRPFRPRRSLRRRVSTRGRDRVSGRGEKGSSEQALLSRFGRVAPSHVVCVEGCARWRAAMHHATTTPILDPTISVQRPRATGHVRTLSLSSAWTGEGVPDRTRVADDSRHLVSPCRLRCRRRPQLIHTSQREKLSNRWQRRHRCFFQGGVTTRHRGRVPYGRLRGGVSRAPYALVTLVGRPGGDCSRQHWWTHRARLPHGDGCRVTVEESQQARPCSYPQHQ